MPKNLWIVTPVYFDVASFLILRDRLSETVVHSEHLRGYQPRFVVIDDTAGRDSEFDRVCALPDTTVIQPPFNLGHQRAIVYGIRRIAPELRDEDLLATLDSDGQDRPEDLPRLTSSVLRDDANNRTVALALRTHRRERPAFKILYFFFQILFRFLTGVVIRTGNYAAYRGSLAKKIIDHPHFDLCYSSTFFSLDADVDFVPCPRGERYAGYSHMTMPRLLTHGLRMLMPFLDRIAVRALFVSSVTFLLGLIFAVVIVSLRIFAAQGVPHWAIDALVLVLFMSALALGNFILLFAIFSQSRGIALTTLDHPGDNSKPSEAIPAYSRASARPGNELQ